MKHNRYLLDTVYGHIPYTGIEEKFLQTRLLNRLLFISQNALAYFAFPSVSTKRYIHSLGTMHMASYLFKHAMLNSEEALRQHFLADVYKEIEALITKYGIEIDLSELRINDHTLQEFAIPGKIQEQTVYMLLLQALRLAGMLHDIGHLPFSHQSEYAFERLYEELKAQKEYNDEELRYLRFHEHYTKHGKEALHEMLGFAYLELLFAYEVKEHSVKSRQLLRLQYLLVDRILSEQESRWLDYAFLHEFISSTVDADRLDYINRDQLASSYASGITDHMRIAKEAVMIKLDDAYRLSYFTDALYDIERLIETRFNLYKKVFSTDEIKRLDTLLEKVITFLAHRYLKKPPKKRKLYRTIALMWKVLDQKKPQKRIDLLSGLDEHWLITLFKSEYFRIRYKKRKREDETFYLLAFEDILFGKHSFHSMWSNLTQFFSVLEFDKSQRAELSKLIGALDCKQQAYLAKALDALLKGHKKSDRFYTYSMQTLSLGIEDRFVLWDGVEAIGIDEISTLRKRLRLSLANTAPFFLYSTKRGLDEKLKRSLRQIILHIPQQ